MSQTARTQFIDAGMRLYPQYGYRQLSVRLLAAESGLSSGMFHHLFESKDAFVGELLQRKYNEGFDQLTLHVRQEQSVQTNLRNAMVCMAFFSREHLAWIHRIFADCAEGVDCVVYFAKNRGGRHMELIMGILQEGVEQGILAQAPMSQYFMYLMSGVMVPMVIGSRVIEVGIAPDIINEEFDYVLSDQAIHQRIEWAINALFGKHYEAPKSKHEEMAVLG